MADHRRPTPPPPKTTPVPPAPSAEEGAAPPPDEAEFEFPSESDAPERDRGVSDFFRRAVSAGFDAASRSKNDVLRVATAEIRSWLDRMDLDRELVKALQKLTLEVKAEVRFRPNDDGKLVPETKAETRVRGPRPPTDE